MAVKAAAAAAVTNPFSLKPSMKKITLGLLALYLNILAVQAQKPADTVRYQKKKLTLSEVNLVSGYYTQDGDHSAVTGGIGTEKLTDWSNTIEIKLVKEGRGNKEHNLNLQLGIDHYTSASSDNIDPATITSASYADTRIYPSVAYSVNDKKRGTTYGVSGYYSTESDYKSWGAGLTFAQTSRDKNRELSLKLQSFFDQSLIFRPIELLPFYNDNGTYKPRQSHSAALTLAQVVNKRLQVALLAEVVHQSGFLSTPFHRVFFTNHYVATEKAPDQRFKWPVAIRASYFAGNRLVIRPYYRYYRDNWGVKAHTVNLELSYKMGPHLSLSPFYRYYVQTAARHFAPYGMHTPGENYFTSDYDLSKFSSHYGGAGLRLVPPQGVLGLKGWPALELRYGRYHRSNGLQSHMVTVLTTFK